MASDPQFDSLQREILGLFENIQKFKEELASIKHPNAEHDLIGTAADQLNAISEETTTAANEIMSAAEAIERVNEQLLTQIKYGGAKPFFEEIGDNVSRIVDACSFHDVTGQRLAKVVRTINAIEGALNSLVVIVGKDAIAALPTIDHALNLDDGGIDPGPLLRGGPMIVRFEGLKRIS